MAIDASHYVYIATAPTSATSATTTSGGCDGTNSHRIRMFTLPAAATTAPSASSISGGTGRPTASPSLSVPSDAFSKSASPGEPLLQRDKKVTETNTLSRYSVCLVIEVNENITN